MLLYYLSSMRGVAPNARGFSITLHRMHCTKPSNRSALPSPGDIRYDRPIPLAHMKTFPYILQEEMFQYLIRIIRETYNVYEDSLSLLAEDCVYDVSYPSHRPHPTDIYLAAIRAAYASYKQLIKICSIPDVTITSSISDPSSLASSGISHENKQLGVRVLVSSCLLGNPVTYRGASVHERYPKSKKNSVNEIKRRSAFGFIRMLSGRDPYSSATLSDQAPEVSDNIIELVPYCPEMQLLGLPAPRAPVRLVRRAKEMTNDNVTDGGNPPYDLIVSSTGEVIRKSTIISEVIDILDDKLSSQMRLRKRREYDLSSLLLGTFSDVRLSTVATSTSVISSHRRAIRGCIMKSKSPSCGVGDARLYDTDTTRSFLGDDKQVKHFNTPFREVNGFFVDQYLLKNTNNQDVVNNDKGRMPLLFQNGKTIISEKMLLRKGSNYGSTSDVGRSDRDTLFLFLEAILREH